MLELYNILLILSGSVDTFLSALVTSWLKVSYLFKQSLVLQKSSFTCYSKCMISLGLTGSQQPKYVPSYNNNVIFKHF